MAYPYYNYGFFDFNSVMQQWQSIGLFDIILPIILIFTIIYAILQRTKILGGNKSIDTILALVIAFFSIINGDVSRFLIPLFSNAVLGISIILVFLLIAGLIMPKTPYEWTGITLIGGIAIFFWVLSRAADYFGGLIIFSSQWWLNNSWWTVPLILFGILMAFVVNSETPEEKKQKLQQKLLKNMVGWGPAYASGD